MQQTPKASPKQHTKRPSRPQRQPAATTATGKTYIPSQKEIHQKADNRGDSILEKAAEDDE